MVADGTTVTWINVDGVPHTVTSMDNRIDSPFLEADQRFSLKVSAGGSFDYWCRVHAGMTGRLVVR